MSTVGQFILYAAANYYLTSELDQCTKVCEFLYEDIEMSDQELFKGNILRFKALALEQDARQDAEADENVSHKIDSTLINEAIEIVSYAI